MPSIYDLSIKSIQGESIAFSKYSGKVLLIVNVASQCDYTPQYQCLQALYDLYNSKGLEILGVPCNQFWQQEPGAEEEILSFCETHYSITFPLSEKVNVKGEAACDLYKFLTTSDESIKGEISWNFEKFLVDREGNVVDRFAPELSPDDPKVKQRIDRCIGEVDSCLV